jgi:hypothetical protein
LVANLPMTSCLRSGVIDMSVSLSSRHRCGVRLTD